MHRFWRRKSFLNLNKLERKIDPSSYVEFLIETEIM